MTEENPTQFLQGISYLEDTQVNPKTLKQLKIEGYLASDLSDHLETNYNFYLKQDSNTQQFSCMVQTLDSKYLLLSSYRSPIISVWGFSQKRIIHQLSGHTSPVLTLCIDPESSTLFSSSSSGEVFKWNILKTTQHEQMFEYQGEIIEMLFSCRCQLLFGNDLLGNVLIFHVKNQRNLVKVCVDSGWNTGFLILEKEMVLVTGSQDSKIRFWDFSGSLKESVECFAGVTCIEKSQNEEFLAIGSHNCKILVVQNFTQKFHLDDHLSTIISMKFINNDKNLVTSSSLNLINLWKLNTKEKIASVSLKYSSKWLVVNDDWVFGVSCKGEITKMNTNDLNTLKIDSIKIPVVSVQMSADSKFLIGFTCKAIFLYDIFNSKPSIFQGHEKEITSIKVKKSANLLVSISDDLTIKLWNIKEKNLRTTLTFHQSPVESFILTKEKLISLSNDLLCIWSFTNDKLDHSISYKTRSFLPRVDRILLSKSKSILVISEIKLKGEVTLIKLDSLNTLSFEVGEFDSFKSLSIPLQDQYLLISEPLFIHVFRIA